MREFASGDESSFLLLFERYKERIYRYVKRMCSSDASAEELFQDIWEKLIKNRDKFNTHLKFSSYIFSIAHNRVIDHFRNTSLVTFEQFDDDSATSEWVSIEDQAYGHEQIKRFKQVFDSLPAPQREIFILHEETSMTMVEIAEAIGTKTETAKSRLRFALVNLRKGMEGYS